MPKEIIVRIGYQDYAISPADFSDLAAIANGLLRVHRPYYTKPYVLDPQDAGETFIANVSMEECDLTPLQPSPAQPAAADSDFAEVEPLPAAPFPGNTLGSVDPAPVAPAHSYDRLKDDDNNPF